MIVRRVGVSVWLCIAVLAALTTIAMSQTLIPDLPKSQEDSSLVHLWRFALRKQDAQGQQSRSEEQAPKTYMRPPHGEVVNWVPMDSGHPLYIPEHADLLREILLDYMVKDKVSPDDPKMSEPNGLQVNNLNGKKLTFKRDASGVITVEDIPVTDAQTKSDGTVSYTLKQSIFNHRQRVHDAWKEMPQTAGPFSVPTHKAPPRPSP